MLVNRKNFVPKTHCLHGHPRTPDNQRNGSCKICAALQAKAAIRRRRIENPARFLHTQLKHRAKARGQVFTIKITDLLPLPERCPALGIPINYGNLKTNRDNWPSVDRVDSTKGYVPGNVAVISYRANRIKNNASTKELYSVAAWMEGSVWPHIKTAEQKQVADYVTKFLTPPPDSRTLETSVECLS